jgi:hypothetical protein
MDWLFEPVKMWQVLMFFGATTIGLMHHERRLDAIGDILFGLKSRRYHEGDDFDD